MAVFDRVAAFRNNPSIAIDPDWPEATAYNARGDKRYIFNREGQRKLTGGFRLTYKAEMSGWPDYAPTGRYHVLMGEAGSGSAHVVATVDSPEEAVRTGKAVYAALRFAALASVERGN